MPGASCPALAAFCSQTHAAALSSSSNALPRFRLETHNLHQMGHCQQKWTSSQETVREQSTAPASKDAVVNTIRFSDIVSADDRHTHMHASNATQMKGL